MPPESGAEPKGLVTLPTGLVTFLFSDIEGSTQRWEAHRDAMQAAVDRHDEILRTAIQTHKGYIFKTVGDAFCAAFASVADGVAAAIAAQREIASEDFSAVDGVRVRMGLHVGEVSEHRGDYFGPDVNRVARLMSIGHGGQVLISSAVQELIEGSLPNGLSLVDLGLRRLKDLTQPEQVWQLTAAGLPSEFPPLNSLDARPNNLPVHVTALIGRERDLNDLKTLIGRHHLVTIAGSGGVGKTRVALQLGAELIDRFADGVWFADLAPITDPELVSSVIAKVLGMTQVEGRRVDEAIWQWLRRKKLLLILDNCEHLLEAVASIADAIMRHCPDVQMVATSRQALGISGEVVHRLPSLATPDTAVGLQTTEALKYGAIALFVDRAQAADTHFSLGDNNAAIVAEICRHLDGIPLAIELAAARVKVLSIPNLAQRLNERFKILTGGSRTALPRQKTLAALIDWSYNLLTPQEQTLFNRVSIFAGGFSLDAATAVCSGEGLDEIDILDLLSSLTDKSLVVADTAGEQERYRLLESTRAYASEKLGVAGDRERLARRHAGYFREQAQEADKRYGIGSTLEWVADVELELDNYRAALEWTLTRGADAVVGGAIAGSLALLWHRGGLLTEGKYWIECALGRLRATEYPLVVARLFLAVSFLYSGKRTYEAAEKALTLYESLGNRRWAARAQRSAASGLFQMGRLEEASKKNLQALEPSRECGDAYLASCLELQGVIAYHRGDIATGRELLTQALATYRAIGNEFGSNNTLLRIAELEFADGNPQEALRLMGQTPELDTRRGVDRVALAVRQSNSIGYRIALGDLEGARRSAREAVQLAQRTQMKQVSAWVLQHLALLKALCEDVHTATRLLGYVDAQLRELDEDRQATEKWGYEKLMVTLREHLSEAEIKELAAEGAAWSEDQAVEEALKV
jgi:predicted ATPase/class 3 adenylate cyclase